MTARLHSFLVATALLAMAGCAHSPQTRILTIDPVPPAAGYVEAPTIHAIQVTGFRVQRELDRIEVVWQEHPNRLEIDDFAHWGAPMSQLARAAFVQDLIKRLPRGPVQNSEDPGDNAVVDVSVEMLTLRRIETRFEADITWSVGTPGTSRASVRTAHFLTPAPKAGAEGEAAALSVIIGLLADDVARQITAPPAP